MMNSNNPIPQSQNISDLKQYVTWQYQHKAPNGSGGHTTTWVKACDTWAAIWPVSAKQIINGMQISGEISHRVRIRYRSIFNNSWRGRWLEKGKIRYLSIVGAPIDPNEDGEWLDILCKEVAA